MKTTLLLAALAYLLGSADARGACSDQIKIKKNAGVHLTAIEIPNSCITGANSYTLKWVKHGTQPPPSWKVSFGSQNNSPCADKYQFDSATPGNDTCLINAASYKAGTANCVDGESGTSCFKYTVSVPGQSDNDPQVIVDSSIPVPPVRHMRPR